MAGKQADIKVGVITNFDGKGLNQAQTGLAGFKTSIAEADGVGGKFKAGFSSLKESVVANAGQLAMAGGAALVAFGVKAVGAFTDTAKAAKDLSAATGLSTEEASRWIAVGDDFEVSAEALTTGLGKISKTLDGAQWDKYGIATRTAGGIARSTNDILLDSLDALGKIENETERAKAGNALFGKGYASLAPLIGKTRVEMESYLGAVEDGQVITAEEAEKAEDFRLAQDQLSDALHEVTLKVGEQVAALAPLLVGLAKLIELQQASGFANPLSTLAGAVSDVTESWRAFHGENAKAAEGLAGTTVLAGAAAGAMELYGRQVGDGTVAADGLTIAEEAAKGATKALKEETEAATKKAEAYATSLQDQIDKLDALYPKEYSAVQAKYDFAESSRQAMIDTDALNQALASGKTKQEDLTAATDTAKASIFAASEDYATLEGAALGSQGAIQRQIESLTAQAASLAPGSPLRLYLEQYIADLAAIPSNISTIMDLHISSGQVTTKDGDVIGDRSKKPRAAGGPVAAGQAYTVGEQGPETLVMGGQNGTIIPNGAMNGSGGNTFNITVAAGADGYKAGQQIVAAIAEYERRSGDDWRRVGR